MKKGKENPVQPLDFVHKIDNFVQTDTNLPSNTFYEVTMATKKYFNFNIFPNFSTRVMVYDTFVPLGNCVNWFSPDHSNPLLFDEAHHPEQLSGIIKL